MFEHIPWEIVGAIAGAVALVFALPPMAQSLRDLLGGSRRARQQILDALPNPSPRALQIAGEDNAQAEVEYIMENGLDVSTFESKLESSPKSLHRALRGLIRENKVQMFILSGIADGSHPQIPAGARIKMPIFFKGGMSPSLRASPEEADAIIRDLTSTKRRHSN